MTITLSDSSLERVMRASYKRASDRATYLTQTGDGLLEYKPVKATTGAWHIQCRANDGTLLYEEVSQ